MEQKFNKNFLKSRLGTLSRLQRLAFLLSCCERLYPNYIAFSKKHEWGNPDVLRDGLDYAWAVLEDGNISERTNDLIRLCEEVIPDTEDFDSVYVSPALDAAVSVSLLLQLLKEDSVGKVIEVASLARDTVDMYVQELENINPNVPNLEDLILRHPLMQKELEQQSEDIEFLKKTDLSDKNSVNILKSKWRMQKRSNIGL